MLKTATMKKIIKVSLDGQSKGVVASAEIIYEDTDKTNDEIIEELKEVYQKLDKFAVLKTIEKLR